MKPHRVLLYQQILSNHSGNMFNVVKVTHLSRSVLMVPKVLVIEDEHGLYQNRPEATSSESISTSYNSNMLLHRKLLKTEIYYAFGTR